MSNNAAWFLRRYRDGNLTASHMRQVLEGELDRLVAGHSVLRSEIDELRRVAPERLAGFDAASDLALQWLGEGRFDLALHEIQMAARDLAELRRAASAATACQRTSAALAGVEDLLSAALGSMPAVRVLRRLRDLARSLLDQGETRKSQFVILLLAAQIGALMTRRGGEPKAACIRMLDELEMHGEIAAAELRQLGGAGYHHLAERLAEDLAAELAVGDRARRATAAGGPLALIESDLAAVQQQALAAQLTLARWLESNS